ncbi:MAG: hypothetical protein JSV04_09935 [Candidatus Heimdallarchaeota archaeon]|nr:MAG: hypothetical protein JSV04_09935 [Candidatus Heimdallarchaeota archaeon]
MTLFEDFENQAKKLISYPIHFKLEEIPEEIIKEYFQKYPQTTWIDLYKLILQATCGWSHLIDKTMKRQVYDNLISEISSSKPLKDDSTPLVELLDNYTLFARLHIRSWKSVYGNQSSPIWKSMNRVLDRIPLDIKLFRMRWQSIAELTNQGILFIEKLDEKIVFTWINSLLDSTMDSDPPSLLPLIHHSPLYRKKYQPSYRIVYYPDFHRENEK